MAYTDRFPIVKNFLETKLTADCDAGETTLYLENVDSLPAVLAGRDYVPLVLRDAGTVREIVYVDAVDNTAGTVTVRRGQEGTTPAAWAAGTYAYCTVTSDSFQRMRVNGFAPLVTDEGRPSISRTSATTVSITGDFSTQLEVGMAVRVLSGDTVVEPTDAELGAIHVTSVNFSAGVTAVSFQNVSLPNKVDGLDLGFSTAAAPLYHPDMVVADEDTLTQTQNVLRVSQKFKDDLKAELDKRDATQATRDDEQDAAIAEAKSSADSAGQAAANAQISANAALAKEAVLPGAVIAWAANSTPNGYLLCNGAAVSRTTYKALFDTIGTTYGTGDGSSTFNLPNLTDKFIQGSGTAGTVKATGLPNVVGTYTYIHTGRYDVSESGNGTGALYRVQTTARKYGNAGFSGHENTIGFDASRSSSIYGASTTVQPPALTMRYYIKY